MATTLPLDLVINSPDVFTVMQLNSVFRKISQSFVLEFTVLCEEIGHSLSSGEAREDALRRLLAKYLPSRVGVDRGFVIDATGAESKQIDVVLYDKTVGTVFEVANVRYFPCESVIAVGEVKSDIASQAKLTDALHKIASVKALDRSNRGTNQLLSGPGIALKGLPFDPSTRHRDQIFGFVFTHSGLSREAIISGLQDFNAEHPRTHWLNLFCDLQRFLISYECETALYPSAMEARFLYCTSPSEVPDLLMLFYAILASFVDESHVSRPNYFSYCSISRTEASYHSLNGEEITIDPGA